VEEEEEAQGKGSRHDGHTSIGQQHHEVASAEHELSEVVHDRHGLGMQKWWSTSFIALPATNEANNVIINFGA